ncbi:MAG: xylose isomerase [Pseudomonadota bacterium]
MSDYFETVPPIRYKGPDTDDPLAYRWYDADRIVRGRRMEDHLRLAVCYWHSVSWDGADPFGSGTFARPWLGSEAPDALDARMDAMFGLVSRLGVPFFTFHDTDVVGTHDRAADYRSAMERGMARLRETMMEHGMRPLWGTANLFSHPRYMAGAATNPDPDVAAFAALQVRTALEATHALGGDNYVLWGGREGYDTLLNTDLPREMDQLGRFLAATVEHKHKIGFTGDILVEPKPHEPVKHQYDRDVATVYGFLKRYGLEDEVRVNIEPNHATLAGNSFAHEVATAQALGVFGSIDFNRGDPQNGWDTDQFPLDLRETTQVMALILEGGGFRRGGSNFDAKMRRQSVDAEDLFHGHIGAIDLLAKALLLADRLLEDGTLSRNRTGRYAGWSEGEGRAFLDGALGLAAFGETALERDPRPVSGRQEYLESQLSRMLDMDVRP